MSTESAQTHTRAAQAGASAHDPVQLRMFVFALFFIFGGITSLNDIIIPKLKELFTLSNGEVMLVQSAFFTAYFLVSLPAASILRRTGYMRTAVLGLLLMAAGCLLFIPASSVVLFAVFLGALFVLAAGVTVVQVVANPLISLLGAPATTHSRLTFAQAFNSLGTTIFPYIGSRLILGSLNRTDVQHLQGAAFAAYRGQETHVISRTYLALAVVLLALALLVWQRRRQVREAQSTETGLQQALSLMRNARFTYGAVCIFLYVGAEVAIGSMLALYLMLPGTLALSPRAAGEHVSFYWGGAMVGRFIGAQLLRLFAPGKVLACAAGSVLVLLALSSHTAGALSGWSLLAVGLFNSLMFPTIFSLACEGLGPRAAEASGIICVAIVGGAVVPLLTGHAADLMGWKDALLIPACCYAGILGFGIFARRPVVTV